MKRWKLLCGPAPRELDCDEGGYPNKDAEGDTQYVNSHYDDEAAAWVATFADVDAGISLAARAVESARYALMRAEKEAADAVVFAAGVREAHRNRIKPAENSDV